MAAVVLEPLWAESGIFEDQYTAISERDFFWPPIRALIVALGLCAGEVPFLVELLGICFLSEEVESIMRGGDRGLTSGTLATDSRRNDDEAGRASGTRHSTS
jgi:hypothetical protein